LGTLLVSLLYVLYADRKDPSVRRKRFVAMAVLAAAIVIPVGFSLVRNSRFAHSNYVFDRFADISFTEKTTRSRFMIWAMSWEGFKERPILGWGQESYTAVFSKYYNPKLYDQEPWFDRAHNIVFDWLINAGIVGLLAYLAMFVFAFRVLWRGFRSGTIDLPTSAILSAGLVAYFFQNLFVFDNFNSYIVFFAILAYLWRLELGLVRASQPLGLGNVPWVKPMVAFGGALLVFGGAIYAVNIRPMQESSGIIDILKSAGNAEPAQVAKEFDRVLGYRTFGNKEVIEQYLRLASDLVVAASIPNEKKLPFVEGALAATEQHLERFPNDVRMRMAIATLYNRATAISLAYAPKARVHIEEAIRLGPNRQQAYFASAENYLVAGQLDAALAVMQKAVELEPNFVDAHMNLGVIAVYAGKHDIVAREVLEIRALAPDSIEPILKIASIYVKVQNFARALDLYKIIVEIDPSIAEHHANLAALYHQQGFKQDAIREAKKAAELDPQNYGASAEKFLKEIGG
jgi:tetratricopeptide (TPR) repeat protein